MKSEIKIRVINLILELLFGVILFLLLSFFTRNLYLKYFLSPFLFIVIGELFRFILPLKSGLKPLILIRAIPIFVSFVLINGKHFSETIISFPTNTALVIAALGYWASYKFGRVGLIVSSFFVFFWLSFGIFSWDNFSHWRVYGVWERDKPIELGAPLLGLSSDNQMVDLLGTVGDSLVVIDTWNSSCGVCFRLIPSLDSLTNLYPEVKFLSLNYPMARDTSTTLEFILVLYKKRKNCGFKNCCIPDSPKL